MQLRAACRSAGTCHKQMQLGSACHRLALTNCTVCTKAVHIVCIATRRQIRMHAVMVKDGDADLLGWVCATAVKDGDADLLGWGHR